MQIPLPSHFYTLDSLPVSAQRLVNMYGEILPPEAKGTNFGQYKGALFNTSGLKSFATVGNGPIRGLSILQEVLYAVSGNELYKVDQLGAGTQVTGTISGLRPTDMAPGDTQMVIISESNGYTLDTTPTLTEITDPQFRNKSSSVTYMDGYWIFSRNDSKEWFISGLLDPTSYKALDRAEKEGAPDRVRAVHRDHRELWIFGTGSSTEIWYNSGNIDFPFSRISGAYIERGCAAAKSIVSEDNTVFWLGDDNIVYRAANYTPARMSTHAIETLIKKQNNKEQAVGWSYTERGHKFYVLRFDSTAIVYDISTNRWHERASFNKSSWVAQAHTVAYDKNLVGDAASGDIYELDPDTYTENGTTVQRIMAFPPLGDEIPRIFNPRLQIVFEHGVGLQTGQGSDPQAMLRWSDDGGRTFSNEHWRDVGKIGKYRTRAQWRRLGNFRSRVFELTMSDPVKTTVISANVMGRRGVN